ncbi:hypothetical protein N9H37_03190 [Congregibacter sp.]|nr:hypothetical protein [Congregibacter sp.]MDA8962339.1 hypothetical protein [Congregibacter sp.]
MGLWGVPTVNAPVGEQSGIVRHLDTMRHIREPHSQTVDDITDLDARRLRGPEHAG